MRFTVYTLFPGLIAPYLEEALLARAVRQGLVEVELRDLRRFAGNRTGRVDDAPYGGGAGMVMKVEPLVEAIEHARASLPGARVVLLDPAGRRFDQTVAREYAAAGRLVLVCGRYEGVDERVRHFVDEELSLGDFVLTGGELAALVVVDACARLVPGVLGNEESPDTESFQGGLLEYPQYTRPPEFRGLRVPEVLVSGDHGRIAAWRRKQALLRTRERRPDLFARLSLDERDRKLLDDA